MSSKRGRKRNDNLPPNRARDVQRAFRARRASHLQALEQRVAELEEENGNLRSALNLPPSNRLPLGKGPTGKEKAKPPSTRRPRPSTDFEAVSEAGSSDGSPTSTQARSLSPSTIIATMRPSSNAVHSLEGGSWDQSMTMGEGENERVAHSSLPSAGYRLPGLSTTTKGPSQYSHPSLAQSSARPTLPGTMYMDAPQGPLHFGHSTDRPRIEAYGRGIYPVRDLREDQDQQRFPRLQPDSVPEADHLPQQLPSTQGPHYLTQQRRDASSTRKRTLSDPREYSLVPFMEKLACRE
ncbi:hypothetical protein EI94DRAFT_1588564 [Lactarius quietus]|nr:hypothetical protein EI94DRAFT_1588564 [Lactarius quietus]